MLEPSIDLRGICTTKRSPTFRSPTAEGIGIPTADLALLRFGQAHGWEHVGGAIFGCIVNVANHSLVKRSPLAAPPSAGTFRFTSSESLQSLRGQWTRLTSQGIQVASSCSSAQGPLSRHVAAGRHRQLLARAAVRLQPRESMFRSPWLWGPSTRTIVGMRAAGSVKGIGPAG